jgi:glycogen operon protein
MLLQPDWGLDSHALAFGVELPRPGLKLHLIANGFWTRCTRAAGADDNAPWRRWIDTSLDSPNDIVRCAAGRPDHLEPTYLAGPRSVVVVWAPLPDAVKVKNAAFGAIQR